MELFLILGAAGVIIILGAYWLTPYDSGRRSPEPPDRGQHGGTEP